MEQLYSSAASDDVSNVSFLLDCGVNVNAKSELFGGTPLYAATLLAPMNEADAKNKVEVVRLLLDHGADVNTKIVDGNTPLSAAIESDTVDVVRLLLDRGADANTKAKYFGTVLHRAIRKDPPDLDIVRLLLDHGADVNAKNEEGYTPLTCAMIGHHRPEAEALLRSRGGHE